MRLVLGLSINMRLTILIIVSVTGILTTNAQYFKSEEVSPIVIEIRFAQHRFSPEKIEVHAGLPIEIRVINSSQERIEFESFKLNREKVVDPGQAIIVHLPALRAGSYDFFDDFHDDVPEGVIVVR